MRAIQRHLPEPQYVELHRITVRASPEVAWKAALEVDWGSVPWAGVQFDLNAVADASLGRDPKKVIQRRWGTVQAEIGSFAVLELDPGAEVVMGAVGRFWDLRLPFAAVAKQDFAAFFEPGWGKVVWSLRVEPFERGSQIVLELRAGATDDDSWKKLEGSFFVLQEASRRMRSSVLARLEQRLDALRRPTDYSRPLPGDLLVPHARYSLTHGVDIEAPPEVVWSWLMQLGMDRRGWNDGDLQGNGSKSSGEFLPAAQARRVGERVVTTRQRGDIFEVCAVDEHALLVLCSEVSRREIPDRSWTFVLEPLGGDASHLVTRLRARDVPYWSEPQAQLRRLKRLCERAAFFRREAPALLESDPPPPASYQRLTAGAERLRVSTRERQA